MQYLDKIAPIVILLLVITVAISRLPKVEGLGHSKAFLRRRVLNWLPLGLTYAFLYMGRYNIKVSQHSFGDMMHNGAPLMTNSDFATIFFWGTLTYGCSFIINGPLTDRFGGRFSILMGAAGSAFMNLLMGLVTWQIVSNGGSGDYFADNLTVIFSALYAVNMYFQSFGAVAIVKCNAPWFHVNERGIFGAIFGILISLGIYFAFDVGYMIIDNFDLEYVFLIPTFLLACFWVLDLLIVKNTPGEAGYEDFDTADASSGDDGPQMGAIAVLTLMLKNPVIMTIACIEFCSGFLRQSIMQWYRTFAKQTDAILHLQGDFVYDNWGLLLCCAGIMGGVFAGTLSDRVFQSRRGPVAAILYVFILVGAFMMIIVPQTVDYEGIFFNVHFPIIGWLVIFMSMSIIGVHGMLSGTASMDFGGKKNVGVAVGIIDGFVYAGTAVMSITYGFILPNDAVPAEAANPDNWIWWPVSMIPVALIGFYLSTKVWNAKPTRAADTSPAT
jgi:OPA family glycerol-3-phosphate transporter-like MFS transporter